MLETDIGLIFFSGDIGFAASAESILTTCLLQRHPGGINLRLLWRLWINLEWISMIKEV